MSNIESISPQAPTKRPNWPLFIGLCLIIAIAILAVWGPTWAPKDPREQKLIVQIDGEWYTPPYRAFTPGYPLGSDNLGRDLYSWLLWSVRPTMALVLIVASLRMAIGVVLGVMAGWSDRLPGKIADGLIAAALSVPALIASIMVITAVGFHLGVWAFVLGLVATGWAETASLVRERTRTIRAQQAVEASIALGADSSQTFFLHIMPQVMPMVWMLLSFEVSNTLVTSAGLGFLGYYLGGAVFQEVDDFVYQRIADMPELGQMLATAWMVLDEPWAMVAAGTVVFIIVLAFNLLGEGLQNRLVRNLGGARSFYLIMAGSVIPWWDDHIRQPVGALVRKRAFQLGALLFVVITAYFGLKVFLKPDMPAELVESDAPTPTSAVAVTADTSVEGDVIANALPAPGGHYWANEFNDPWRTRVVDYTGPTTDTVQWTFETPLGFVGGPAIDKDGVLYIAARDQDAAEQDTGLLYAIDSTGSELWKVALPAKPVGVPALAIDGVLYVCDKQGVSAFDNEGSSLWRYDFEIGKSPAAGPVVSPDGDVYIKAFDGMWALNDAGEMLWHAPITDTATALAPSLSPDGAYVFWDNLAFRSTDGALADWTEDFYSPDTALSQILVGADGEIYRRYGEVLLSEAPVESDYQEALFFDGSVHTWGASDAGVTADGRPWLLARPAHGSAMGLGFYWGFSESTEELSGRFSVPQARNIHVLAVDQMLTAYVCMDSYSADSQCVAIGPEGLTAKLRYRLRGVRALAGAALAPGSLYVATRDGTLMAIGDDADVIAQRGEPPEEDNTVAVLSAWDAPVYPGGHYWSHEKGDPWGTRWAAYDGPADAQVLWAMENGAEYTAAPVVAADGTIYASSTDSRLLAYAPDGSLKWSARLIVPGVGSPAIGPDGTIYITDEGGYLLAFDANGEQKWVYHASGEIVEEHYNQSTGDLVREEVYIAETLRPAGSGPMVAPDGTVYFTLAVQVRTYAGGVTVRSEVLQAVTQNGVGIYDAPPFIWDGRQTLRLSANNTWLVLHDHSLMPRMEIEPSGKLLRSLWDIQEAFYADEEHEDMTLLMVTGADGGVYQAYKRTVEEFVLGEDGVDTQFVYEWDAEASPGTLVEVGATHDGHIWMFFRNGSTAWVSPDGTLIGPVRFPLESMLFGLDRGNVAYGCGSSMGKASECMAYSPGLDEPLWHVTLQEGEKVAGGALAPGVVYVTTEQGRLYALGTP